MAISEARSPPLDQPAARTRTLSSSPFVASPRELPVRTAVRRTQRETPDPNPNPDQTPACDASGGSSRRSTVRGRTCSH